MYHLRIRKLTFYPLNIYIQVMVFQTLCPEADINIFGK